jgi:hypothetical protein
MMDEVGRAYARGGKVAGKKYRGAVPGAPKRSQAAIPEMKVRAAAPRGGISAPRAPQPEQPLNPREVLGGARRGSGSTSASSVPVRSDDAVAVSMDEDLRMKRGGRVRS